MDRKCDKTQKLPIPNPEGISLRRRKKSQEHVTMQEVTRKKNHDFFQLYSCKGAAEMKGNFFGYRSYHQTFPLFILQFKAVCVGL